MSTFTEEQREEIRRIVREVEHPPMPPGAAQGIFIWFIGLPILVAVLMTLLLAFVKWMAGIPVVWW